MTTRATIVIINADDCLNFTHLLCQIFLLIPSHTFTIWLTVSSLGGLDDSQILAGDTSKINQLNTWLLPRLQSSDRSYWALCWRASSYGWGSQTFHSYCDDKGPTVTIVGVGSYIFGGYTDQSWRCMYN